MCVRFIVASIIICLFTLVSAQVPSPTVSDTRNGGIPSEPGMYLQETNGFNKILGQIVSFTRSGSLLVSNVTVGIKTRKQNVQLLGPHAQTVVDGRPIFYFIPPKQEADAGVNAGDFVLIRLEEKPQRRQFEVGAQGMWRASSGISITHQFQLVRLEVRPGTYSITPAVSLTKGEYALYLARGEGMQAYVYDFSVDPRLPSTKTAFTTTPKPGNEIISPREGAITQPNASLAKDQTVAEISSEPTGADIEIDGQFAGSTPSSVGLTAGEHKVRVSKSHYRSWERTVHISTGTIALAAELDSLVADQKTQVSSEAENSPGAANIVREPVAATSVDGKMPEEQLGISFDGNAATRSNGLEVSAVRSKGPAETIGIQARDVILAIDGRYIYTINEFRALLIAHQRGTPVAIRFRHDRLTYDNHLVLASKDGSTPK
jgi:hypothetical protein